MESIRPDGRHGCKLGPPARYSCTVYPATEIEIEAPGVIGRVYGNNSLLGEPSGEIGADVNELTGWFVAAGPNARRCFISPLLCAARTVPHRLHLVDFVDPAAPAVIPYRLSHHSLSVAASPPFVHALLDAC